MTWPLVALLALYPLWWVLGLGVLIFPIMAVPMAYAMVVAHRRGEPLRLPPGFALWLIFLATVVAGFGALGADPAGMVPGSAGDRFLGAGFRLVEYASLTVLLLYAGNLPITGRLTQRRLIGLLAWLFVVTVAGGLLGTLAGRFALTSPVELLLPTGIRSRGFVRSLVHPYAAQIMDVVGDPQPRPAAPWGYTNTWGNNFCLLVVWFVVAVWASPGVTRRTKMLAGTVLGAAVVPVVHSLNRGLWVGLAFTLGYIALRQALRGRLTALAVSVVTVAVLVLAVLASPLGDLVDRRLEHGKSNGVRLFLTERAITGFQESPLIGYGSTRNTIGGRQSITVGESASCERCGNFTVGGNGQLWQLLFAHGLIGTASYLGFFGWGLWRFRRDRTPVGLAGSAAILGTGVAMFWYNALVTPLAFTFLAYALLWRADTARPLSHDPGSAGRPGLAVPRLALAARPDTPASDPPRTPVPLFDRRDPSGPAAPTYRLGSLA